ncbi:MAG: hypothetical protein AVDCRST_MAG10-700 [uncultured Acidimicrobiales bacterium]|uniref:Uncharacterized protein n=1 Tax=uncultured Acidimicrobiales bacterium TaxID=310071 RepID=A0A6J4HHL2_9ACTN|nr:MAG: hypothetical protein AVDCRST_MAG10-700 [uncultured Acidimicrobiales bacterium]
MTASRIRQCAVAAFIALTAGACGAAGDDGRLTGAKGQYAAQVDPICAELQGKIGELGQQPEQQAKDVEDAVNRIKAVSLPKEDDTRAQVYIAAMENLYLALQDVDQSRRVNDQARAERALEGARINNKTAAEAAESYGLVECAREL